MNKISSKYKIFKHKKFLISVLASVIFLIISLVVSYYAGSYATEKASNPVTDIILTNIRVYDVDVFFLYGPFIMWLFVAFLCIKKPQRIPFVLVSISTFVLIRSMFITLTHIGPFPTRDMINYSSRFIRNFSRGGDLFFSAHTGLPFLMALIFNKNVFLKYFFLALAVFFGIIVLMGHLHYTIDVMSAFFITYTIYVISSYLFKTDKEIFNNGIK